jgi:hypothetical protein
VDHSSRFVREHGGGSVSRFRSGSPGSCSCPSSFARAGTGRAAKGSRATWGPCDGRYPKAPALTCYRKFSCLRSLRGGTKRSICAITNDPVPHPSRSLRRVGCHCSAPGALPPHLRLSHPSQRARRMGHPALVARMEPKRISQANWSRLMSSL